MPTIQDLNGSPVRTSQGPEPFSDDSYEEKRESMNILQYFASLPATVTQAAISHSMSRIQEKTDAIKGIFCCCCGGNRKPESSHDDLIPFLNDAEEKTIILTLQLPRS